MTKLSMSEEEMLKRKYTRPYEERIADLEDKLANADYQIEGRDLKIKDLEAQIDKIRKCANCPVWLLNPTEKNCKDCKYKEALIILRR
jgi:hypothetical protein